MQPVIRFDLSLSLSLYLSPGFAIYFFYGIRNSSEAPRASAKKIPNKNPIYTAPPADSDTEAASP